MQLSISEILTKADKAETELEKINILRKEYSRPLIDVLMGAFDTRIQWLLPEGPVPYTPTKAIGQEGNLYMETRRFYLFAKGGNDDLPQTRREALFIQMLEHLDPRDAALVASIKDKKLPYKTITPSLIKKAFPTAPIVYMDEAVPNPEQTYVQAIAPPQKPKRVAWNKGLTKDTDERVKKNGLGVSKTKREKGKKGHENEQIQE